ncbi:MarR family winged helix-turn-helix transcriptional regulator [Nocardia sp. NPDC050175]|uniref:MarR family winged helix-turn-helix transcriptional regulator n=1 Tax=Nocardia sp. NPDC050175 TaxID=3364317 RepID=UPI003787EBA6
MTTTSPRLRALPSRLLSQAATHSDRLVSDGLAQIGARKWHYAVLATLADTGPASQAEMSRRTGIYRSDMVAVLNELERDGYAQRVPDPDDQRRNVITLTKAGTKRLHELDAVLADLQQELLTPLTATQREQLAALLTQLVDHHDGRHDRDPSSA